MQPEAIGAFGLALHAIGHQQHIEHPQSPMLTQM